MSAFLVLLTAAVGIHRASFANTLAAGESVLESPGRTVRGDPSNYLTGLKGLRAGDRLVLAPGIYPHGLPVHGIVGAPERSVTIEGASASRPSVFVGRRGRNTVSIVNSAYVTVRNLRLDGLGLPVDAVKAEGHATWAHHITLENLVIVNHGHDQQTVGISTKCPAWGWVVRANTIVGAGTGMYFGSSDGTKPFFASVIESNTVANPRGYALQVKHQHDRLEFDGVPSHPSFTVIRRNRFIKREGASVGELARPNVLVGHFPLTGQGADDYYVVYGNVFDHNPTEALFQGEGNIALYNNLFLNPAGNAIHIQPHNHLPRSVLIFHNTVLASGVGISIRGGEKGYKHYVGHNAVFARKPFPGEFGGDNFPAPFGQAATYLAAPFAGPDKRNLGPLGSLLLTTSRIPPELERFPEWSKDYSGLSRIGGVHGACQSDGSQTGTAPCR